MYVRGADRGSDRGQVAAIAAVLTLALVVVALAITQSVVVPQQNEEVEFRHQQEIQQDMQNVRDAVLGSADTATGQTATIRLGTTYPERIFLQNPEPPQGNLMVEGIGVGSVSNAVSPDNPETTDFWSGTARSGYINSRIVYDPGYNYYDDAPRTGYESSVLYRNQSGQMSMQSGQAFVNGRTLSLAFVDGDRSFSSTGTTTIQPRTLSASQVNVDLRSPNAEPMVLRIPTRLPESTWDELLAAEYDPAGTDPDAYVRSYSCSAADPSDPCGVLTLKLEPGVTYDVKLSKVGLKGATEEPAVYLTALRDPDPIDEGKTRQFTVQVRDRYNNPVSGREVRIVQPAVGEVVGPTNVVGEVSAITDEDGRATFTYRAPLNVPGEGATATFGVEAPGIEGDKGRVDYEIDIRNTADPVDPTRQPPLLTAVNPDATDAAVADGGGDYVRVNVTHPDGVDTTDYTLDLVNRDRSVVNTVALDRSGLDVLGAGLPVGTDADVYFVGGTDNVLVDGTTLQDSVDLNDVLDQPADVYVVGPNVYRGDGAGDGSGDLSAFADHYGLDDGEANENDIVVRAGALAPATGASVVDGTLGGGFADADPNSDDDNTVDIIDDARGTVLLREGPRVVDAFAYRTTGGQVTAVSPASPGGASNDEFVRLEFDRPTDLDGADDTVGGTGDDADYTASVVGDGRRETVGLGPVADRIGDGSGAVTGPVYVVGDGIDIPTFASERGVSPDRVFRAGDLAPDGLADGDFVPDGGGVVELRDGQPGTGEVVDERAYDGVRRAHIDVVDPINATGSAAVTGLRGATPTVSADEYARLTFDTTVDTSAWTLMVDDGSGRTARLDLTPLAGTTDEAPGPVYLLGQVDVDGDGSIDAGDRAAFAAARGVAPERVVFAASLTQGDAGLDAFDDDGAALTLQDAAGDTVDTYTYGDGPSVRIGTVTPRDATRDRGSTDEFVRLDTGRAIDSTGWTLSVDDNDGTVERLDLGTPAVRNVLGAGADLYVVGQAVDRDRFAAERGVDPAQVVRAGSIARGGLADPDVLDDDGATLRLTDARDRPVDAYTYENDALFDPVAADDPSGGLDAGDRLGEGDRVTGRIDTADPTDATAATALGGSGDGLEDEYVRLSFPVPTDTTGWTLQTSAGANLPLDAVAPQAGLGGPIYVVGEGLDVDDDGDSDARDRRLFADAQGVSDARVYPASALVADPADASDFLEDGGETLTLRDAGGVAVDRYTYDGDSAAGSGGSLSASLPNADPVSNGDGASEFLRLDFSRPLEAGDLNDWAVSVANRDRTPDEIALAGLTDGGAADATGQRTVYLVGEGVDPATFAAARDLDPGQVRSISAVDGGFAGQNVLPDDASTLRLRDAGDDVRDRYDYRGLDAADARIAGVTPRGALGGGSDDEATRLAFPEPTDTAGWTLAVDDGDTTTFDLVSVSNPAAQGGSVYLVGNGVDIAAFADARGVSEARVVPATALADAADIDDPDDVFADGGATLTLRDDAGVTVDTYTYDDATDEGEDGTAVVADATPAADADANDELVDLSVTGNVPVETGWSIRFEDADGDTVATADLSGSVDAFASPGRTLLVGDLTNDGAVDGDDREAAAEAAGVPAERVLLLPDIGSTAAGDGNFLADAGGRIVLLDGAGATVDTYTYDSAGTAGVTAVEPTIASEPGAEFARLDFGGPVDTDAGQGWQVTVRGTDAGPGSSTDGVYDLSGTAVDDAASTGGPVFLVGDGLDTDGDGTPLENDAADDIAAFADARGVSEARVFRFSTLRTSGADDGDALPDLGGELLLQNGDDPRTTVDRATWGGGGGAAIGDVGADLDDDLAADGDADDRLRLDFPGGTDVSDWTVEVDDATPTGGPGPVTLSLSDPAVDTVARAGESVYVVGDYNDDGDITTDDADDYAAATDDVGPDQVFTTEELGAPEEAEVLADAGGTVTLRDATGEAADTVVYGSELRSGRIADVVPMDATDGAGSSDEFARLTFRRPADTTGYELTVLRPASTGRTTLAVPLDDVADVVGDSGGPVYLVGESVDVDAFAAERAVSTDRVLVLDDELTPPSLPDSDVLADGGAELVLRGDLDDDGTAETELDRYGYGTEQPRTGDWEHDFGDDTEEDTAYRDRDDDGMPVDTNDDADWFDSPATPGEDPAPASDSVRVEAVTETGRDTDGDGDEETTGLEIDLANGDGETRVVAFATTTDLATGVDDAGEREADVPVTPADPGDPDDALQSGYANDPETGPDGTFAADGTVYRFAGGGTDYDGQDAVVPAGASFSVAVEEYRDGDGSVADLGTLVRSEPGEADVSVTLVFEDGSRETVHLEQRPADIAVTTTVDEPVAADGGTVTFTTTAENLGPGDAPGPVRIDDEYDTDQFSVVSASPSAGSYDPGSGTWTLADGLADGETETLTVTLRANGTVGDVLPYTTARTASGAPDPDADNDVSTAAVSIGGADLELTMTSPADGNDDGTVAAEAGAEVEFDLTVTNNGPADAPGTIRVTDELPDGLRFVDSTGAGSYDPNTGIWTLPGLAEGESAGRTITATVSSPSVNAASITDTGSAGDPVPDNNDASIEVVAGPCTTFADDGETILLYSTFETDGADDRDRLENAGWSGSEPGVAGVDDATSAPPETSECDQSAYHADGSTPEGEDGAAITSPEVDTRGFGLIETSYWVQPGGSFSDAPEAGEDLLVQYNNTDGEWVTVDRFAADNGSLTDGVVRSVYLPGPTAKHDGFQLRFKQVGTDGDGDATADFWHVDNVQVVGGPRDDGSLRPVLNDVTVASPSGPALSCGTPDDDALVVDEDEGDNVDTDVEGRDVVVTDGTEVDGNVQTDKGGDIFVGADANVGGNVQTNEDGDICVGEGTEIDGNAQTDKGGRITVKPDANVGGNVQTNEDGDILVGEGTEIDGDVQTDKAGDISVGPDVNVGGDVQTNEGGDIRVERGSEVDGNVQADRGTIVIEANVNVGGNVEGADLSINPSAEIDGSVSESDEDDADGTGAPDPIGQGNTNCIDSPSQCTYTATFGYESTYDAPVFVSYGSGVNLFEVSDTDGSNAQPAGEGPETVSDGPGPDDQPARPEEFLPGRHDRTTRVSGFEYERAVTYYLPADSVTAYGLVTEYGVDVRLNDDRKGSILQGQYLEYGVRINNTGPDGTPDRGPTGESAKIKLSEGITDVSALTITTRPADGSEPVVLDTTRGTEGDTVVFTPGDGAVGPTGTGEGGYATYDPETNVLTVGGLPDPGEAVWLNVSTRLPADDHDPITVDAALTYRQTADPETAPADPTPANDPDSDSLTVDPLPINCRGTVHQDGNELVLTQPLPETAGGDRVARVTTFGTLDMSSTEGPNDASIILGPYRDVDDDGDCEAVYLRAGDDTEGEVVVMNPDDALEEAPEASNQPKTAVLATDADFSNSILTTGDRDGNGIEEVYYAGNANQNPHYVEVTYDGPVTGTEIRSVDSDSGVFAYADTNGNGLVETFFVGSGAGWGFIEDGSVTTDSGGVSFNAGYPRNATGAEGSAAVIPYGGGPTAGSVFRGSAPTGDGGLGLITAAGADTIQAFDAEGTHGGGRVTFRDSDYDGEYEIVFVGAGGTVRYYNLPPDLAANYRADSAVTLVDEDDGGAVTGASNQGVQ